MVYARPGVGPLLRTWRHRPHLSQSQLAHSCGLSPRHLSFVETGRSRPSPEVILHLAEFAAHQVERLRRQHAASGDPVLAELLAELAGYPAVETALAGPGRDPADGVVLLLRLASPQGELNLLSTVATFGAPHDITTSELAIESFFPADGSTAAILASRAGPVPVAASTA